MVLPVAPQPTKTWSWTDFENFDRTLVNASWISFNKGKVVFLETT